MLICSLICAPRVFGNDPADRDLLVQAVLNASTGEELSQAYQALFVECDDDAIKELTFHDDDGLALVAQWEQVTRTLDYVEWPDENDPVDGLMLRYRRTDLQRLLGTLEGRLRYPIPDWWEAEFLSMRTTFGPRSLALRYRRSDPVYAFDEGLRLWINREYAVAVDDDSASIALYDETFAIPRDLISVSSNDNQALTVAVIGSSREEQIGEQHGLFLLRHSPIPFDFDDAALYRISPQGEIVWQQPIRCQSGFVGGSGPAWCVQRFEIAIDEQHDRVHLFGIDISSLQLHSFAASNGIPVLSFNTQWGRP